MNRTNLLTWLAVAVIGWYCLETRCNGADLLHPQEIGYAQAYAAAQEGQQPMVILISARWCGACQVLRRTMNLQTRKFVYWDIEAPEYPAIHQQLYRGGYIPRVYRWNWVKTRWVVTVER